MSRYRNILDRQKGQRELLRKQRTDAEVLLQGVTDRMAGLTEAREVVNNVMVATQVVIKDFIEEVVSLGLKTVFGDPYGFKVEYEIKRNKSEASLWVTKGNEQLDPSDECGGGVVDIAAIGLRMACWALAEEKPEPVLLLDEPGKYVSRDLMEKFGIMLKEASQLLGLQVIMVSHDATLIEQSDQAFQVTQTNGISDVEIIT